MLQGDGKLPGKYATFRFHRWSLERCWANRSQGPGYGGEKTLSNIWEGVWNAMQAWQWFGAALQPWSRGENQRAWVEWYTCRSLTYLRPESDHGGNAEGLYQVLLFATGACKRAWIIKDTGTQFNTRIFHGMVVPMLAMESSRIQYMGCAMPWSSYRFIFRCRLCHAGWACVQFRGFCTYTGNL